MKKIITLSMFFMATALFAQEEVVEAAPAGLTVSGSIDAYYQTNLTTPDDVGQSFGTSFANQTGFAFGMGNIIVSYEGAKTGAVLDLVTGPRGNDATTRTGDIVDGIVNQAYAYWNVSEGTTLTLGRFNTFLGYEVIAPAGNFNYSTSYLFSAGPFSHMGLKADFALSDDFSLMLAVTNPVATRNALGINNTSMTGEVAYGLQLGAYGQYLNVYYDSANNGGLGLEIDYTGGFDVSDEFFLGVNAAYQVANDAGFYGAALYPQYAVSEDFSLGLRGEYFAYHEKDVTDLPSVFATTLTGSFTVESLIIKPEVRLDSWSNAMPYANTDGVANMSDNLAAFTLAAIYTF